MSVEMIDYMFLGDTHGDLDLVANAADLACQLHIGTIIQVGDWGFLWPGRDQLMALTQVLREAGATHSTRPPLMRFVDGNHDWHPELRRTVKEKHPDYVLPGGGVLLTNHVVYQPRGSTHTDADGTRFLFVGGSSSIDQANRVEGLSWWPEEDITEDDFDRAARADGPFHVMVTHDAPHYPPGFRPAGNPGFRERSGAGMDRLRRLVDVHRPEVLVHGHWHTRYATYFGATKVVGLDCNYGLTLNDAVMIWRRDVR